MRTNVKVQISSLTETQPTQAYIVKCVNKATQGLWTQTGQTLEHVVLYVTSINETCYGFML